MFINYFRSPTRGSPVNIVAARAVLGLYVIWKTVWYDWELVARTPFSLAAGAYTVLLPSRYPIVLTVEKWALILAMLSFIVGYRLLLSSFLGATLLGHLAAIRFTLNPAGGTTALFIGVWFIIFFGLFHEQRGLAVDSLRSDLDSLPAVNRFLKAEHERFRMDALRWSLLSIALVYFGAGFLKVLHGPLLEWATVENLSRTIVMMNAKNDVVGGIGPHIVQYPSLVFLAAVGTLVLELGFLLAVIVGISITPFVLGFYTMQVVIGLSMGPFFFDIYPLFLLFLSWDGVLKATNTDRPLDVVYDEHCLFCARSLLVFKALDVRNSVDFYSQYDVPERHRDASVEFESAMYAFQDGETYRGYFAFRKLLDQYGVFSWLTWVMGFRPIAAIGQRCYELIAGRRNRYFTCSVE